ncbi:ankyrin-related protein [Cryptosporidium bovis]|uniref:ankyrin-related protein n=1 Tax=Cryptosporidium bovis TaxID=310047 RepID=UPI00351A53CC|nr:ankyrin-related protein [Cryptosporidium bovis]
MDNQNLEVVGTNTCNSESCYLNERAKLGYSNATRANLKGSGVGVVLADDCYYSADEGLQFENEEIAANVGVNNNNNDNNAVSFSSVSSFGKFSNSNRISRSSTLIGKLGGAGGSNSSSSSTSSSSTSSSNIENKTNNNERYTTEELENNDEVDINNKSKISIVSDGNKIKHGKGHQYSNKLFKIVEKGILRKDDGKSKSELNSSFDDLKNNPTENSENRVSNIVNSRVYKSNNAFNKTDVGQYYIEDEYSNLESYTVDELNLLLLNESKTGNAKLISKILMISSDLKYKLNVNISNERGFTPLHWASLYGHSIIVKKLLNANADPNKTTKMNCTPLHFASANGFDEIVSLLLKFGAKINVISNLGSTPLSSASIKGYEKTVKLLIKNGSCLDYKDKNGFTLKDLAESNGHFEVAKILQEAIVLSRNKKNTDAQNEETVE